MIHELNERLKTYRGLAIVGVLMVGVLYLHWKDMSAGVPRFDELEVVVANSFRSDIGRDPLLHGGRASIEFWDDQGHRFQTPRMSDEELDQIRDALRLGVPIQLRYGRWLSPFPSTTIFTVYQLEVGNAVIIPYERLATAKQKERDAKVPIMLISILVIGGACYLGMKLGKARGPRPPHNNGVC